MIRHSFKRIANSPELTSSSISMESIKRLARLALAEEAVQAALRLRPDAGEATSPARESVQGYLDYDGALAELATASQTLPNDPNIFGLKGAILRRQGKQEEALQNLEHAVELDPLNFSGLLQVALSYEYLRRYADEKAALDRALALQPDDVQTRVVRAYVEFDWKGILAFARHNR